MKKRTSIDFSKHVLTTFEDKYVTIYEFKIPGTYTHSMKFINTSGVMTVTGDWGNWVFCREFHPGPENGVSDGYWIEKLHISSCQKPYKYDSDETTRRLKERLQEIKEEYEEGSRYEQLKEYYESCLENVDDYYDYIQAARDHPGFMDAESIIEGKELNRWLEAIFDGFDEICSRMKVAQAA
jgi:hypothetical protein